VSAISAILSLLGRLPRTLAKPDTSCIVQEHYRWWQREPALRLASPVVAAALSVAITSPGAALPTSDARDLFYQELKSQDATTGTSVAYCLELHRGDEMPVLCNNRFAFKSGDGVRLHLKTSSPLYTYIALIGSSGKRAVLYPPPGSAEDNRLEAGKEYVVPPHGQIVFDDKPGTERLFVILTKNQQDVSNLLNERGMVIDSDSLTGIPQQVGDYSVLSNDGFYELGRKAPGSGLVFVNNPDPQKPTTIALALSHSPSGEAPAPNPEPPSPNPQPQPNPEPPKPSPQPGAQSVMKVKYYVASLHNDGNPLSERSEIIQAFKRVNGAKQSGVNGGARDQYVAALNHMYANWVNQQVNWQNVGMLFYLQELQNLRQGDTGERIRLPNFSGQIVPDPNNPGRPWSSPAVASYPMGMASLEESLSGGKSSYLAVGSRWRNQSPKDVHIVETGHDLDAAWEGNNGEPLIIAVDCAARLFQPAGPGGHVVVLSDRRDTRHGPTLSSHYDYRLLNSWGNDTNGKPRNGWVNGDAVVSAMNYTDPAHDQSVPPERLLDPDALPVPGENQFARGDDGFILDSASSKALNMFRWVGSQSAPGRSYLDKRDNKDEKGDKKDEKGQDADAEAHELRKHAADSHEGLSHEDRSLIDSAIKALLKNSDEEGHERRFPLSDLDKAAILHEANCLFTESAKIYAQGLDQGDRNRSLVGMLHDTANPEHTNQGGHNTCNVTTIMKIETLVRPAAQVKRFVDMYTNANGDNTVDMPL